MHPSRMSRQLCVTTLAHLKVLPLSQARHWKCREQQVSFNSGAVLLPAKLPDVNVPWLAPAAEGSVSTVSSAFIARYQLLNAG